MMQAQSASFTHHGGRVDEAARRYPRAPLPWLDLSTGINPVPWKPGTPPDIDHQSLPTRDSLATLEAAAAAYFGVAAERVVAVPGSEIGLRLLPMLGIAPPLVAISPCYGTHSEIADRSISYAAIESGARSEGSVLLANPNNPDGRALDTAKMLALAQARSTSGGWLVVDEAFADANPDVGVLPHLTGAENVIAFRSFGKFFGLAGLRLGFVVAPPAVVARLRSLIGDWPVSAEAIRHGTEAYRDSAWIDAARGRLADDAARLDALLARHDIRGTGACPLFRLVAHDEAGAIFDRLARKGILVRPFADHPRWLRFGLPGDRAAFDRLDRALSGD